MRIKASKKFSKLGSANNWSGFGKENFIKLESGEAVECNVSKELLENNFVEKVANESKSKKDK